MKNNIQPQDKFIKINGLNIHYLDWGNREADPILLVHGLCSNAHYWDFFARNMMNDCHILAIDQRGHGDSSRADSYGPKDYVLDLESFIDSLQLPGFTLIGHSMGGINAIIYSARYPEQVSKLVIVDIGPEINATGMARMERERKYEPDAFSSPEKAFAYMKSLEPRQTDEFISHQLKYALRKAEDGSLTFKYDKKLKNTELRSPDWLWEYINQIICPTLLVHGTDSDMLTLETSDAMVKNLIFGSLINIEISGHSTPADNPQAFEKAIRNFLKKTGDCS